MATNGQLTNRQFVELAEVISLNDMESVALKYFNIDMEKVLSLKTANRDNPDAFKRELLRIWANKNPGINQVKKLAILLYQAADEHGYVDPHKVKDVLVVPRTPEQGTLQETEKMSSETAIAMKVERAPCINGSTVDMHKVCIESTSEQTENTASVDIALDAQSSQNELEARHGDLVTVNQRTDQNRLSEKKLVCHGDLGTMKTTEEKKCHSQDLTAFNKVPNNTHERVDSGLEFFTFPRICTTKMYIAGGKCLQDNICSILKAHREKFEKAANLQVFLQGINGSILSTKAIPVFGNSLTHLCVSSYYLGKKELKVLSQAVGDGTFSRLRHLCFISCHIRGFDLLFKTGSSSLCHLQLNRCFLSKKKCSTLSKVINQPNRFPCFKSLAITDKNAIGDPIGIGNLFKNPSKSLRTLLIDLEEWHYPEVNNLAGAVRTQNLSNLSLSGIGDVSTIGEVLGFLPLKSLSLRRCSVTKKLFTKIAKTIAHLQLHELNISQRTPIGGNLHTLFSHKFPTLVTLTLRNCGLNSEDFNCLVHTNIRGKLPKLKHLDIARNNIGGVLQCLFRDNCKWNRLLTLNILDTCQEPQVEVLLDCLTSLQNLIVPDKILKLLIQNKKSWTSLRSLRIFANDENILLCLADAREQGFFPTLQNVCVKMADERISVLDTAAARKLLNLSVHDTIIDPTDPDFARCLCYDES